MRYEVRYAGKHPTTDKYELWCSTDMDKEEGNAFYKFQTQNDHLSIYMVELWVYDDNFDYRRVKFWCKNRQEGDTIV